MRFKLCPAAPRARVACCTLLPPYHPHPLASSLWIRNKKAELIALLSLSWKHAHQVIQIFYCSTHVHKWPWKCHECFPKAIGFPDGSDSKESAYNVGDLGSVPRLGRSPGEGNGSPLQYSCLEKSMDRGAWRATVAGVTKSWTQLND